MVNDIKQVKEDITVGDAGGKKSNEVLKIKLLEGRIFASQK